MIAGHWLWPLALLWAMLIVGYATTGARGAGAPALVLRLEMDESVRVGTSVSFKITLQNTSNRPVALTLGGRPAHDVVVTTLDGREVWRWSHGEAIQAILELKTLQPGEVLESTAVWGQRDNTGTPVPVGRYRARGVVKLDPPEQLTTEPKPLSLVP